METEVRLPSPDQRYKAAHKAHYGAKDLRGALELYRGIIRAHPDTSEAGYSRSQIDNIVRAVVPDQELFDANVKRALAHLTAASDRDAGSSSSEEGK